MFEKTLWMLVTVMCNGFMSIFRCNRYPLIICFCDVLIHPRRQCYQGDFIFVLRAKKIGGIYSIDVHIVNVRVVICSYANV